MADILVVEDEEAINELIRRNLSLVGHTCYLAMDGETAVEMIKNKSFDLIVLDIMLPEMDGFEVLEQVKGIPTILLTARSSVEDRVKGLIMGADDYLTKPFSATELMARIRVALRHLYKIGVTKAQTVLSVGGLSIDLEKRIVSLDGAQLHVTPLEYHLLTLFLKNPGKVLTTQYILKEIYGVGYGTDTQALRALMAGLRRKIEPTPAKPRYILTEIGVGYRLVDE